MIKLPNESDFITTISKGHTLVDFFATWCGPCQMMGPVFEKLSNEINYVNFAKVDVDQHRDLALHYQVQSIPTIILFKDGKIVDKFTGFLPKEEILKFINQHVK